MPTVVRELRSRRCSRTGAASRRVVWPGCPTIIAMRVESGLIHVGEIAPALGRLNPGVAEYPRGLDSEIRRRR